MGIQGGGLLAFMAIRNSARRADSWALLQHFKPSQPGPWFYMGDFNEVVAEAIIKGGRGSSKGRPNGGIPVSFGRVSTGRFGLFGV
jgi:hypothetical protein